MGFSHGTMRKVRCRHFSRRFWVRVWKIARDCRRRFPPRGWSVPTRGGRAEPVTEREMIGSWIRAKVEAMDPMYPVWLIGLVTLPLLARLRRAIVCAAATCVVGTSGAVWIDVAK